MRVIFRVDSSWEIASGHVMRCISLARFLYARGCDIVFLSRELPGNIISLIAKDFTVVRLGWMEDDLQAVDRELEYSAWLGGDLKKEIEEVTRVIKVLGAIDWLIVDHYALDIKWEKEMKKYVRHLMVIDDLANREHICDLLLDQNFYKNFSQRYNDLVPKACKLLLGPKYVLLRSEFLIAQEKVKIRNGEINRILIFMGGSDMDNITSVVLRALCKISFKGHIDVVFGVQNKYRTEIAKEYQGQLNCNFYCQIDNMAELMLQAELAIGAGGSTTWERCCMGLPSVLVCAGNNEKEIIENGVKIGIIQAVNCANGVTSDIIAESVEYFLKHPRVVNAMSAKCMEVVDGFGCERVSQVLYDYN